MAADATFTVETFPNWALTSVHVAPNTMNTARAGADDGRVHTVATHHLVKKREKYVPKHAREHARPVRGVSTDRSRSTLAREPEPLPSGQRGDVFYVTKAVSTASS